VEPDFGILGRTALLIDGSLREDWGTRRERAVLTALLVHAGRLVPIDTLTEWVWPEGDPDLRNPVSTIHTYATRIRKWLQRLPTSPDLFAGAGGCRLEVDESLIDYHRFRAMIREAREHIRGHRPLDAAGIAERALRLWRGPPLEELHSELARAWRARVVHDEWLPAQGLLVEALLELGQFDEAIARLDDIHLDYGNDVTMAMFRLSALHGQARFSDAAISPPIIYGGTTSGCGTAFRRRARPSHPNRSLRLGSFPTTSWTSSVATSIWRRWMPRSRPIRTGS
jgi:hypothetical protein